MNNDLFVDDPIFAPLRSFAAAPIKEVPLPVFIKDAFLTGFAVKKKRRFIWRSSLGALLVFSSVPAFAATDILPEPIQNVVEKVNNAVTSPVRNLFIEEEPAQNPAVVIKTNNGNSLNSPNPNSTKIKKDKAPKIKVEKEKPIKVKIEKPIKPAKVKPEKIKPEKVKPEKKIRMSKNGSEVPRVGVEPTLGGF